MHNPIQKISLLYYEALASFRSARSWLPLLYFWGLLGLCLWALTRFMELPGGGNLTVWFRTWFDADVAEYPRLYLLLPDMQRKLYLILAISVGILLRGVSMLHLLDFHTRGRVNREHPWRRSLRRWPGLFVIKLLPLALFLSLLWGSIQWAEHGLNSPGIGRGLFLGAYGIGFIVEVFMLYASLLYLAFEGGIREAIMASIRFAYENFWVTLGLVAIPFFLALPIQGLVAARGAIVHNFRPEIIFHVLMFTSLLTLAILFLQISTTVRFYTDEVLRKPFESEWDDKPVNN